MLQNQCESINHQMEGRNDKELQIMLVQKNLVFSLEKLKFEFVVLHGFVIASIYSEESSPYTMFSESTQILGQMYPKRVHYKLTQSACIFKKKF